METENRNYGIDLLRIISMMMVIVLHINSMGGLLSDQYFTASYNIAFFMDIAAIGAVDIYALISGYVGYGRKRNLQNMIRLWTQAIFYCLLIELIYTLIYEKNGISLRELALAFFPVTNGTYWYLTSYVVVFLFIPVLNWSMAKMNKSMATKIVLLGSLLSWWDLISKRDIFKLNKGYSAVWLVFLYFTGSYARKYYSGAEHKMLFRKYCGRIYLFMICMVYLVVAAWQAVSWSTLGKVKGDRFFVGYTALPILIAAIALLLYFSAIEIKRKKVIVFFAPTTFGVYLIHNHPIIAKYIMPQIFSRYINSSLHKTIAVFIVGTISIFIIAALIDKIRDFLFSKLMIYTFANKYGHLLNYYLEKVIRKVTFHFPII